MIEKLKSTKCIGNLFGRGRRTKTTGIIDRLIQRKVKLDRQKSASPVKAEIENELGISIHVHVDTIRNRVHEARLFGRVARKKPYVNKINRGKRLKFAKEMLEKLSSVLFGPTSENSTFLAPMVWRTLTVVVEMPLVMMIHSLSVIVEYIALYIYISLISRSVIKISP